MNSNNWERDLGQESIISKAVEKVFFPFLKKRYDVDIQRKDDLNHQFSGTDYIMVRKGKTKQTFLIDLKAQTNGFINNPTDTFCLEISYLKDNQTKIGWFMDNAKKTTHYLFMWINEAKIRREGRNILIEKPEDIKHYSLKMVRRQDIDRLLDSYGLTKEHLTEIDATMRTIPSTKDKQSIRRFYDVLSKELLPERPIGRKTLTICRSDALEECPVNVVIPNSEWDKIARGRYEINHNTIYETIPVSVNGRLSAA